MNSLNREIFYEIDKGDSDDEIEEVAMTDFERRQMKQAMKESGPYLNPFSLMQYPLMQLIVGLTINQ